MHVLSARLVQLCLAGLLAAKASAEILDGKLSFGHVAGHVFPQSISPSLQSIEGWKISGEEESPRLLSDRVIITPPYPGHRRGAIWSESKVPSNEWRADFEFRATGPERGGGNLQLWYTKENHGTASIYTVGKFDGLALVIDTHAGSGGIVRAFLNDGTVDYKNHHAVDSLSFGHCKYAYRNLGRPSRLQLKQTGGAFEVSVDDHVCFKSDQIRLPADYLFGVTAASAETPDSFEIYKFVVHTSSPSQAPPRDSSSSHNHQASTPAAASNQQQATSSQVAELQTQLDKVATQLKGLEKQLDTLTNALNAALPRHQTSLSDLSSRFSSLDSIVRTIQRDVEGRDYKEHLNQLQQTLSTGHANLLERIPASITHVVTSSAPRMGMFVGILVFSQIALAVGYVVYKKRRAAPKKYL
ncbi:MAG: hypothetical protein M1825_002100 [Sarcosagium campestre]|nr:MAG: hypothetical protein M1825_002100 [Sarcosagium campestre]